MMHSAFVRLAFFVALLAGALFPCAAMATPAVVQTTANSGTITSLVFGSAPSNGDLVFASGMNGNGTVGSGWKDSNGVNLTTREQLNLNGCIGITNCWETISDYLVSGSPTATYTHIGTEPYAGCAAELSGVNTSAYATSTSGTSQSITTTSGAIVIAAVIATSASAAATLSGVSSTTTINSYAVGPPGNYSCVYGTATGTSVTATVGTSGTSASIIALAAYSYLTPTVSVVQTCAQSGTTCVFGSAPATNSEVVGGEVGSYSSSGCVSGNYAITDSNSVALSERYCQVISGGGVAVAGEDYKVPGTPTATYACSSGTSCGLLNITGATIPGTYATNSGGAGVGTTTATLTTTPGDLLVCTGQSSFLPTFASTAFSGGTSLSSTYVLNGYGSGSGALLYATAIGTSASCTTTNSNNTSGTIFVGLADYTAATTTSGCPPYPFPCVFQPAYAPHRKVTLADLLR